MKARLKLRSCILSVITFLLIYGNPLFAQEKINLSTGIGLPELLNVGVRYQLDQTQIGLSAGLFPGDDIYSISGDVFYHFGGFSEKSSRRPWYGRVGLDYVREETDSFIGKYFFLNTRIGREFNISSKIGLQLGVGAFFELSKEEIEKEPPGAFDFNFESPVLPSAGIALFYRI